MKFSSIVVISVLIVSVFCACVPTNTPCTQECQDSGYSLATDNKCILNCWNKPYCGESSTSHIKQACLDAGYIDKNGVCDYPTFDQCVDKVNLSGCKTDESACVTKAHFEVTGGACVIPNCMEVGKGHCQFFLSYCRFQQGYEQSTTSNDCVCDVITKNAVNNKCSVKLQKEDPTNASLVGASILFLTALML